MSDTNQDQNAEQNLFRSLDADEQEEFRQWARANYTPGQSVNPTWHPVVREECAIMQIMQLEDSKRQKKELYQELAASLKYVAGSHPDSCLNSVLFDGLVDDEPVAVDGFTYVWLTCRHHGQTTSFRVRLEGKTVVFALYEACANAISMGQPAFIRVVGYLVHEKQGGFMIHAEHVQNLRR